MLGLKSKAKSPKRIVAIELSSSDLVYAIVERPEGTAGETRLTWRRLPWRTEAATVASSVRASGPASDQRRRRA